MKTINTNQASQLMDIRVRDYAKAFGANGLFRVAQPAVEKLTLARKRAASVQGSRIARIVNSEGKAVAYQVFQEVSA